MYPQGTKRKEIKTPTEQAEKNILNMFDLKEENTQLRMLLDESRTLWQVLFASATIEFITIILLVTNVI